MASSSKAFTKCVEWFMGRLRAYENLPWTSSYESCPHTVKAALDFIVKEGAPANYSTSDAVAYLDNTLEDFDEAYSVHGRELYLKNSDGSINGPVIMVSGKISGVEIKLKATVYAGYMKLWATAVGDSVCMLFDSKSAYDDEESEWEDLEDGEMYYEEDEIAEKNYGPFSAFVRQNSCNEGHPLFKKERDVVQSLFQRLNVGM